MLTVRTLVRLLLSELGGDEEVDVPANVESLVRYLGSGTSLRPGKADDTAHELFLETHDPSRNVNDVVWLYKSGERSLHHDQVILADVDSYEHSHPRRQEVGYRTCYRRL